MNILNKIKMECDLIIRVADARNPKTLFSFPTTKKTLIVFNKMDLITPEEIEKLKKKYKNAIFTSTRSRKGKGNLLHKMIAFANMEDRLIRVGVVGYPNVGKSSIINMMRGTRSAKVSATPGETRGVQWLKIKNNIMMYDTPGVITVKHSQKELVKTFSIVPQNVTDPEGAAFEIIKNIIKKKGKESLEDKYKIKIKDEKDYEEIIGLVAKRNGMLLKNNELDRLRASKKIILDFQKGN
jgi:ribosome biogenesis GTPase A